MAEKPKKLNRFESGTVELRVMSEEATSFVYYGNMPTKCIQGDRGTKKLLTMKFILKTKI